MHVPAYAAQATNQGQQPLLTLKSQWMTGGSDISCRYVRPRALPVSHAAQESSL